MPWYYAYSPVHGYCTSKISTQQYCPGVGGGPHPIVRSGFNYPLDIVLSSPCPQRVDFVGTYTIRSIRVTKLPGVTCLGSVPGGIDDAVEIEMYQGQGAAGNVIGNVLFAHIRGVIPNGIYNTVPTGNGITATVTGIGWIPRKVCVSDDGSCAGSSGCGCYTAMNLHMEAKWHYNVNWGLENCALPYPSSLYGTTWIYEYFVP